MPSTTTKTKPNAPAADEVPVTRGMLAGVRTELHEVKSDIHGWKADMLELKAVLHEVKATMARIEVLLEEQSAQNKIILDGITALLSRQNQVEQRVTHVEDTVRMLAGALPAG